MHDTSYKSALARRACRYSDARPPRKTDGVLLESEIPPHMRGKVVYWMCQQAKSQDHPRICGEKFRAYAMIWQEWGSPPHMRGKGFSSILLTMIVGITPACAGKRPPQSPPSGQSRDHPRICGEKSVSKVETKLMPGLPPHVQGKGLRDVLVPKPLGITPAYAGKSHRCRASGDGQQDHPRMCGEKPNRLLWEHWKEGSPPHMRGKVIAISHRSTILRITPAYAGVIPYRQACPAPAAPRCPPPGWRPPLFRP